MITRHPWIRAVAASLVSALLVGAAASVEAFREKRYPAAFTGGDQLYLTSGDAVKRLTVGYNALAADLYWIRAIQYFGGIRLKLADPAATLARGEEPPTDYSQLYPLLDVTTTLDPLFNIAYRFGSLFLAEPFPGGAGRPDLAIELLMKGVRERPEKWEYLQDIGFVHYWWLEDYEAAARWFERASQVPGSPWWLRSLTAVTLAEGGDRSSSRMMWRSIYEFAGEADNEWLRRDAERRLQQLDALDQMSELQAIVDRFVTQTGAAPSGWPTLVRAGLLRGIPVDPLGNPYALDAKGRVHLDAGSKLLPLPVEPKRLRPPSQ